VVAALVAALLAPAAGPLEEDAEAMTAALRRAIDNDELFLEYQPIASLTESRFVGVEALLRWRRPGRGVVSPDNFIPLAEETGLILPIGQWVVETACAQLRTWRELAPGSADWYMSVNVAASQLDVPDFPEVVAQALDRVGLDGSALRLELTETAHIDAVAVGGVLQRLRDLGIRLLVDDFGTKHSTLSYLMNLPIDELKVDRMFVEEIAGNRTHQTIVDAIFFIGRSLDLAVTAEGVENEQQLDELRRLGCVSVQGHYLSQPLPPEDCLDVLLNTPMVLA
jgi:EAL domain-containing protein (putative c-di-GMP-specific phosphodiesterase class I)